MENYTDQTEKQEVKDYITTIIAKYIEKHHEDVGEIEHVIDYFNVKEDCSNIQNIPYLTAVAKSAKWIEALKASASNDVETEEDVEVIKDFKDGFKFVKLVGKEAFLREGKLMSHCVGSYFGKRTLVYSLRDGKNNPHATLEVNGNNVNQIKGKGNGEIHPKYVKYVIKMLTSLGKEVRSTELTYLGYSELSEEFQNFLEEHFTGIKYITYNNGNYFYNRSKLVKK